jgi:IclR family transcriptional regulator, acetate operon repressor
MQRAAQRNTPAPTATPPQNPTSIPAPTPASAPGLEDAGRIPDAGVARVAAVLGAFEPGHRLLRVSAISRRSGLPMSTTSRLVGDLVHYGLLRRAPAGLEIGEAIAAAGRLAPADLVAVAVPYLADLAEATRLTAHLAVLDPADVVRLLVTAPVDTPVCSEQRARGDALVCSEQRAPGDAAVCSEQRGLAVHACAAGKVLLAGAAPRVVERVCAGALIACGPRTITDGRRLRRELDRIRGSGLAYDCEESGRGIGGLAVAVPGKGVAVSVTGPVSALDPRAVGPALHVVARALGRETAQSRT